MISTSVLSSRSTRTSSPRDCSSFSKHGYTKQEFDGEELVDVDEDEDEDYESEIDDSYDDIEE